MKKYVDKSEVVAEIERLIETNKAFKKTWKWKFKWFYRTIIGRLETLEGLKAFLDTPEVKEMDLEKELDEWMRYGPHTNYPWCTIPDAIKITAEHFFELGLKTKGE